MITTGLTIVHNNLAECPAQKRRWRRLRLRTASCWRNARDFRGGVDGYAEEDARGEKEVEQEAEHGLNVVTWRNMRPGGHLNFFGTCRFRNSGRYCLPITLKPIKARPEGPILTPMNEAAPISTPFTFPTT
jgi:hypothetical protein